MNDLNPKMQERLEKWKADLLTVKGVDILKKKSPGNFVPRQRDYGDDIRDYEEKEAKAWQEELSNNPMYIGYR